MSLRIREVIKGSRLASCLERYSSWIPPFSRGHPGRYWVRRLAIIGLGEEVVWGLVLGNLMMQVPGFRQAEGRLRRRDSSSSSEGEAILDEAAYMEPYG